MSFGLNITMFTYRDIELEVLALEAQEADDSGTIAMEDRLKNLQTNGTMSSPDSPSEEGAAAVPINENLFLDDDLGDLEDELDDLELDQ